MYLIDKIQSSFEGELWIKGKRIKTGVEYKIPLLNIPQMIIERYREKAKGNLVLPVYNIISYNKHLKTMAQICGISKRFSSHLARHSFATLTLSKGVSIESVSKMLGHSNIQTTQIYSKVTENKVGNEMTAFAGNVKKWDSRLQLISSEEDVSLESVLQTFKISTGKASDMLWENLIAKVWHKLSNIDRHSFVSEIESRTSKPGTLRDFYISLMDFFLDGTTNSTNIRTETKIAVNF
jgi:hypothetical protein